MTADARALRLATLGWLAGSFFFFYAWVLRVSPSVMVEELMLDFSVGAGALGQLSALYFYGYAGMQIPVGLLLDRFGPRRLMTAAAVACALGCLLFAVSSGFGSAALGRFVIGAGGAFSLVGAVAVAGQWLPERRFALLSGLAMAMGMLGGMAGQAPFRLVVDATGWRVSVGALSALGLALALAIWLTVRDRRRGSGGLGRMLAGFGTVAARRQTWLNAMIGLGGTGPLLGFAALWGVPYFQTAYGVERATAGAITSFTFVGMAIGCPAGGAISDWLGRRRPVLWWGLVLASAALAAILYVPGLSLAWLGALCLVLGLGLSSVIVCFAVAREQNPRELSGTAIGIVNACVTGAGALFQPLVGLILDLLWDGATANGVPVYQVADYRIALGVVLAGNVAAALCVLWLREEPARPHG